MSAGYYKMHRGWLRHPVLSGPFCRAAAWAWLIDEAAWKPTRKMVCGSILELQRGQLTHSLRFMADAWGWKKDAVKRFIGRLESETMIATATETGQLVITICNYNEYQSNEDLDATDTATLSETQARQERDSGATNEKKTNKPINQESKSANLSLLPDTFDVFWEAYPRKVSKGRAEKAYRQAIKNISPEQLLAALKAHSFSSTPKFVPHAATWLNDKRWLDREASNNGALSDSSTPWLNL